MLVFVYLEIIGSSAKKKKSGAVIRLNDANEYDSKRLKRLSSILSSKYFC